mmetsp:Transcript_36163/g.102942  ORF Transcript_36163/g.102942 Transcript_36163/m.102942 type:complete len:210 (-) Transcript_36163:606-1235(-)
MARFPSWTPPSSMWGSRARIASQRRGGVAEWASTSPSCSASTRSCSAASRASPSTRPRPRPPLPWPPQSLGPRRTAPRPPIARRNRLHPPARRPEPPWWRPRGCALAAWCRWCGRRSESFGRPSCEPTARSATSFVSSSPETASLPLPEAVAASARSSISAPHSHVCPETARSSTASPPRGRLSARRTRSRRCFTCCSGPPTSTGGWVG